MIDFDMFICSKGGLFYYISPAGQVLSPAGYTYAGDFSEVRQQTAAITAGARRSQAPPRQHA